MFVVDLLTSLGGVSAHSERNNDEVHLIAIIAVGQSFQLAGVVRYEDRVIYLFDSWKGGLDVLEALEFHCNVLELRCVFQVSLSELHVTGALVRLEVDGQPAHCGEGGLDVYVGGGAITFW